MNRRAKFGPGAYADASEALAWEELTNGEHRARLEGAFDRALGLIEEFPQIGAAWRRDTRRFLVSGYRYAIIYRIDPGSIAIIAFAHTSRDPDYWLDRLP